MKNEELLMKAIDYSAGQCSAAYSVLGEIVNILGEYSEDMLLIGGWVPALLFPEREHIGSIVVDILLNQNRIKSSEGHYMTIRKILERHGYSRRPDQYFTYTKTVVVDGVDYDVDVDFLSGKYGGDGGKVSKHVDGLKTLPATGGNFAFELPPADIRIEYTRGDGSLDFGHVKVISVLPYLVMKAAALGRGKPKDAYDIYFTIKNYEGGVRALAKEFLPFKDKPLVRDMVQKLDEKFMSPDHSGPGDIASFLDTPDGEDTDMLKQDAYQTVHYLVMSLGE